MRRLRRFLVFIIKIAGILLLIGGLFWGYKNFTAVKKVYSYEETIAEEIEKNNITDYKELAMSIMLTESKGEGNDPMQSSESAYGKQEQFENAQDSIEQGIAYLAELIDKAAEKDCDLWTAVQAYNFGTDYIDYVAENGGENTLELAETYSKEVLSPLLGNDNEQTYRYWGWQSITYNGGYLYHNGGNLFYADVVKFNLWKIKVGGLLFS
jgi:hypothetical protein